MVPIAKCSNSHGFKYLKKCTDVKVVSYVEELWPKVYQRCIITNNDINMSFEKGVLVDRNLGCNVNSSKFCYRNITKRVTNTQGKLEPSKPKQNLTVHGQKGEISKEASKRY
jgi:hypothetical protein